MFSSEKPFYFSSKTKKKDHGFEQRSRRCSNPVSFFILNTKCTDSVGRKICFLINIYLISIPIFISISIYTYAHLRMYICISIYVYIYRDLHIYIDVYAWEMLYLHPHSTGQTFFRVNGHFLPERHRHLSTLNGAKDKLRKLQNRTKQRSPEKIAPVKLSKLSSMNLVKDEVRE